MIRLNKLTDYAVVLLAQMAREGNTRFAASQLASVTGIPEPTVAKLLKDLGKAGLVESARGANGGYSLAHVASTISVRMMIEAIEGPISLTDCVDGNKTGCAAASCGVRGNWDGVNAAIIAALDAVTLDDMMRPQRKKEIYNIVVPAKTGTLQRAEADGNAARFLHTQE